MGKRRSRHREESPLKGKHKEEQQVAESTDVEVHETKQPRQRISAFGRYAQERPVIEKVEKEARENTGRGASRSPSPPIKRRRKSTDENKDKQETSQDTAMESYQKTEDKAKRKKEKRRKESGVDTSEDVIEIDIESTRSSHVVEVTQQEKSKNNAKEPQTAESSTEQQQQSSKAAPTAEDEERSGTGGDMARREDREQRSHSRDRHRESQWDDSPQHRYRGDQRQQRDRRELPNQKPPDVKTFPFDDGRQCILVTKHPERISVWGVASVRSLLGTVQISGFLLRPAQSAVDVYSPNTTSFITLETSQSVTEPEGDLSKTLSAINELKKATRKEILAAVDTQSNVLLFAETIEKQRLDFVTNIPRFQQIFWSKDAGTAKNFVSLGSLPIAVNLYPGVRQTRISKDMTKVCEQFCAAIQKGETPSIAVCGGKNVGKSTLCRFLTNSGLNKCRQVAYLDCDVGQTEFSPPGCVSLHLITVPVLGPPFTHQRTPHRMLYFGAVTPSDDPQYYLTCVKDAFAAYTSLDQPCPLVVNTMGWNEGLGLILLATTLSTVRPNYVVQINSDNRNRNLPAVTPQFVTEQERWPTIQGGQEDMHSTHDLLTIQSAVNFQEFRDKYHPADHRDLSLLGYLGRYQAPGGGPLAPLHGLTPQTIPWGRVAVHVNHAAVPNSQVLYALNASIVGLCRVPEDMMLNSDNDSVPRFLSEKPVCDCLGFGIVRSIDPEKKVFHIISDLPLGGDSGVNCLLRGSLDVPHLLIANQPCVDEDVPYYGESKDVVGATAIRRRRHLVRRGRGGDQNKQ